MQLNALTAFLTSLMQQSLEKTEENAQTLSKPHLR